MNRRRLVPTMAQSAVTVVAIAPLLHLTNACSTGEIDFNKESDNFIEGILSCCRETLVNALC